MCYSIQGVPECTNLEGWQRTLGGAIISSQSLNMWFSRFRYGQRAMNRNRLTIAELADIHFIYDLGNGNGLVAVPLYGERCPTRWQPNHQTFTLVHQNQMEYASFRATINDTPVNSEMDLVA
ncbi:hypothetical protein TNCV_4637031 [Trichonephila clavipes]|nr:hypothetical protein TNCV_4637031 [Trichonephila clavipes]